MKIKKGFVLRKIAGTVIAVPTGELLEQIRKVITLTGTGEFIWQLLQEDTTIEEISKKIVEEYEVDLDRATKDTQNFIKQLKEMKIIEE